MTVGGEQKTTANDEQLDEAATEWLSTIAVRGTAARVLRVRRLYDRSEDMRRQFYGDVSRIERDPGTLGIDADRRRAGSLAPRPRSDARQHGGRYMVTTILEALEAIEAYLSSQADITEPLMPSWANTNETPAIVVVPVGVTYTHDDTEVGRRPLPPWRAAEIELQFRVAEGAIDGEKDALDMAARVEAALVADPTCGGRFEDYDDYESTEARRRRDPTEARHPRR